MIKKSKNINLFTTFNKKGFTSAWYGMVVTVISSVALIIILSLQVSLAAKNTEKASLDNLETIRLQNSMLDYLQYSISDKDITMGDLILLAENNEELKEEIGTYTSVFIREQKNPQLVGIALQYPARTDELYPIIYQNREPGQSWWFPISFPYEGRDNVAPKLDSKRPFGDEKEFFPVVLETKINLPNGKVIHVRAHGLKSKLKEKELKARIFQQELEAQRQAEREAKELVETVT